MPSERGWTRNLIIASSFGPELSKEIQGEIPPFRSSYESSAFLATQLAINDKEPAKDIQGKLTEWLTTARVFEIERSGSVLSFPANEPPVNKSSENGNPPSSPSCAANPLDCKQIQPEREDLFPKFERDRRIILALAALIGCLVWARIPHSSKTHQQNDAENERQPGKANENEHQAGEANWSDTEKERLIEVAAILFLSAVTLVLLVPSWYAAGGVWVGYLLAIAVALEYFQNSKPVRENKRWVRTNRMEHLTRQIRPPLRLCLLGSFS